MKFSQVYRAALIATMVLMLSSELDTRGFAQANSLRRAPEILSWSTAPERMDRAAADAIYRTNALVSRAKSDLQSGESSATVIFGSQNSSLLMTASHPTP